DLLLLDRRQLDEAGQAALAGHADADDVAPDLVAREELLQRLAAELVGVGVGLAEDLGVLDEVEGGGGHLPVLLDEADGLQAALPQVDAPNPRGLLCHCTHSPPEHRGQGVSSRGRQGYGPAPGKVGESKMVLLPYQAAAGGVNSL